MRTSNSYLLAIATVSILVNVVDAASSTISTLIIGSQMCYVIRVPKTSTNEASDITLTTTYTSSDLPTTSASIATSSEQLTSDTTSSEPTSAAPGTITTISATIETLTTTTASTTTTEGPTTQEPTTTRSTTTSCIPEPTCGDQECLQPGSNACCEGSRCVLVGRNSGRCIVTAVGPFCPSTTDSTTISTISTEESTTTTTEELSITTISTTTACSATSVTADTADLLVNGNFDTGRVSNSIDPPWVIVAGSNALFFGSASSLAQSGDVLWSGVVSRMTPSSGVYQDMVVVGDTTSDYNIDFYLHPVTLHRGGPTGTPGSRDCKFTAQWGTNIIYSVILDEVSGNQATYQYVSVRAKPYSSTPRLTFLYTCDPWYIGFSGQTRVFLDSVSIKLAPTLQAC